MAKTKVNSQVERILTPGSTIAGKYLVMEPLGTGAFSHVMRARHEVMGRDVALKVLKPEMVAADPEVHDRFLTEARIISRLHHPNTVTVYDFGETTDGLLYMVMEHVDGVGLESILKRGALPVKRVAHLTKQILKSLDEAHALGVIHRDLKPSNIMLTKVHGEGDFVKVLDFGVAKLASEGERKKDSTTTGRRSTRFIGTPVYMSPEQVLGDEVVPASDIYSLGLILYEMLTGDPPLDISLNVAAVAQIHIDDAPIPFERMDDIPSHFQRLIRKATARDPQDRFQNVREFARALPKETLVDMTGEFRKIVESERDVFSGKNYIAIPDSEVYDEPVRKPEIARGVDRQSLPKRPVSRRAPESELQLDIGRIKRTEIQKKRTVHTQESSRNKGIPETSEILKQAGSIVGGGLLLFVTFMFLTSLVKASVVGRLGVFVLHIGATLLWTQFSTVRNTRGGFIDRWGVPFAQHAGYLGLIEIGAMALIAPGFASSAMLGSGDWVIEALGFDPASLVGVITLGTTSLLHTFFSIFAGIVPW